MPDQRGQYQLVFFGLPPGTSDEDKAGYLSRLIGLMHMKPDQALAFLELRHAIIQTGLSQGTALAVATRFRSLGLNVVAVSETVSVPSGPPAPAPQATPALPTPPAAKAAAAIPVPPPSPPAPQVILAPPAAAEFLPQGAMAEERSSNGSPAPPPEPAPDSVTCPECGTKVRVRDPAHIRCAMCSATIQLPVRA